jgi:hypothetical protein
MSVSIILREGESIQDAMARAKTTILKQQAQEQLDRFGSLSMEQLDKMFNTPTQPR